MTEAILTHGTFKVRFRSSQNTKWPFSRIRNSWYDAENDGNFPKLPAGSFTKKNWMRQYNFGIHLYRNNSGNLYPHILSSSQRILKTIREFYKYFGWVLFLNIGKYRFSFKFRVKFCKFHKLISLISLTLHFIIKWQKLKICFKAARKYAILPKRWEGCYFSIELLSNITGLYFLFKLFSFYK